MVVSQIWDWCVNFFSCPMEVLSNRCGSGLAQSMFLMSRRGKFTRNCATYARRLSKYICARKTRTQRSVTSFNFSVFPSRVKNRIFFTKFKIWITLHSRPCWDNHTLTTTIVLATAFNESFLVIGCFQSQ